MISTRRDIYVLRRALPALPALTTLTAHTGPHNSSSPPRRYIPHLIGPTSGYFTAAYRTHPRQLNSLLSALPSPSPVTHLTTSTFTLDLLTPLLPVHHFTQKYNLLLTTFARLTHLSLTIHTANDLYPRPPLAQLGAILATTTHLTTLTLGVHQHSDAVSNGLAVPWHLFFADLLSATTFPHLHSLVLTGFTVDAPDFIAFFARHHHLRDLRIETVFLASGDWATVLHALHPQWSGLRSLELAGTWGAAAWAKALEPTFPLDHDAEVRWVGSWLDLSQHLAWWAVEAAGMQSMGKVVERYCKEGGRCPVRSAGGLREWCSRVTETLGEEKWRRLKTSGGMMVEDWVGGTFAKNVFLNDWDINDWDFDDSHVNDSDVNDSDVNDSNINDSDVINWDLNNLDLNDSEED